MLAFIGVLFWLSTIIQSIAAGFPDGWGVVPVGIVLGGAHVAISWLTSRHSRWAVAAMWFVFVSDSLLAIFIDFFAIVLVLFTVVLLLLARTPSAREWYGSPRS